MKHRISPVNLISLIILQIVLLFAYLFVYSRWLHLLVPEISSWIIRILDPGISVFIPLLLCYLFLKNRIHFSKRAKIGIVTVLILVVFINGFMFLGLLWGRAFSQEKIFPVIVPGTSGSFVISRFASIPEGEGFRLFQISNGIFRKEIAHSYRWHKEYQDPYVELYGSEKTPSDSPLYIYHVMDHTLELFKSE